MRDTFPKLSRRFSKKVKVELGRCLNTRLDQKERQDIRNQSGADRNSVADLDDGSTLRAAVLVEVKWFARSRHRASYRHTTIRTLFINVKRKL